MSESKKSKPAPDKSAAKEVSRTAKTPVAKPAPPKTKSAPPAKPAAGNKQQSGDGKAAFWLSLLSLAASVGLAVAAFFFWNQQQQFLQGRDNVSGRVDNKLQKVTGHVDNKLQAVDTTISRVKSGFEDFKSVSEKKRDALHEKFANLQATQRGQNERIDSLNSLIGRSTQDWALAEAEYLLRVASERVQLQRDIKTALVALENADQRILELSDPGLMAVRQQIASERDQLKRVPVIDREGLAGSLDALLSRLDKLPVSGLVYQTLVAEGEPEEKPEKAVTAPQLDWKSLEEWKKIPQVAGEAIRKLVTIREHDQPVRPMMQPGSETFLRQNLRIQVEAARLALLREDPVFYKQAINTASEWLTQYYAVEDADVQISLEQLQELGSVQIRPEMPDISNSLRMLRKHQELAGRVSASPSENPDKIATPTAADSRHDDAEGQTP